MIFFRIYKLVSSRQSDKEQVSSLEKRLTEERRQRQNVESQLTQEKKARKELEQQNLNHAHK